MLTARTVFGAVWSAASRFSGRIIDFLVLLVLARALTPADFGLTALALSIVVVTETILDVPLVQALTSLKAVTKAHLDTAFTIALIRSGVIFAVLAAVAWPLSLVYGDPNLELLVTVLALGPVTRSLLSPRMVDFIRAMEFRRIFLMEVGGKVVAAGLTLCVAWAGGGYWAIVANSVASPMAAALLSYVLAPYRPALGLAGWGEFRAFLGWLSLSQMLSSLNWQLDRMLLGHVVPKSTLGQYAMAGDVAVLPTQTLIGPAMSPLMAALGRIGEDPERRRAAYLKAARFAMTIALPASVGISLTAEPLSVVLLGPGWPLAADYLGWISLTLALTAYYQPLAALAFVAQRTDLVFRLSLYDLALRLLVLPALIWLFLIPGALAGRGLVALAVFGLTLAFARRLTGASIGAQLANLWKVAAATLVMAVGVLAFRQALPAGTLPPVLDLAASAGIGVALYGAALLPLGTGLKLSDLRGSPAR